MIQLLLRVQSLSGESRSAAVLIATHNMEELPCEMVEHILSFLPLASLSAVWEVDMRMREVLRSEGSILFKYITPVNTLDLAHKHGNLGLAEFLITRPGINPNKLV